MTAQSLPNWVIILAAILTPAVALGGLYIARQQWITNRNKLRLELFQKRYAYYEAARDLVGYVLTRGNVSNELIFEFSQRTKGAKFVVGADIAAYFDNELYRKAGLLHSLNSELEALPTGPDRSRNVENQRKIKDWFQAQYDVLDDKFGPLLKLQH